MRKSNNFITSERAIELIKRGYIFRQNLEQTEFKVCRSVNDTMYYRLNKNTAHKVKGYLNEIRKQKQIEF